MLEAFVDKVGIARRRRPEGGAEPAVRPARALDDRGRPRLVHGARPALRRSGRRRSPARSTACAARSGRSPSTWSTRSAYRRRCCAHPISSARTWRAPDGRGPGLRRVARGPALGDLLRLDRRTSARAAAPSGGSACGSDLRLLYESASEIGRQPPGSRILDVPCGGGVALRGLRQGQGVRYVAVDIAQAMLDRTFAAARDRGVADQVQTADRGRGGTAVRRRRLRAGRLPDRPALLPRPGTPSRRCAGSSSTAGC